MLLLFIGVCLCFIKGVRFVFVLLSLELIFIGCLMSGSVLVRPIGFIVIVVFGVLSSLFGLAVVSSLVAQFGRDMCLI